MRRPRYVLSLVSLAVWRSVPHITVIDHVSQPLSLRRPCDHEQVHYMIVIAGSTSHVSNGNSRPSSQSMTVPAEQIGVMLHLLCTRRCTLSSVPTNFTWGGGVGRPHAHIRTEPFHVLLGNTFSLPRVGWLLVRWRFSGVHGARSCRERARETQSGATGVQADKNNTHIACTLQ